MRIMRGYAVKMMEEYAKNLSYSESDDGDGEDHECVSREERW